MKKNILNKLIAVALTAVSFLALAILFGLAGFIGKIIFRLLQFGFNLI